MKELLAIMLGGVLVNNYAMEKFLGVCPVLGGRRNSSAAMGFSVCSPQRLPGLLSSSCSCRSARSTLRR